LPEREARCRLESTKRYLDMNEVADYIGVSRWTVYSLVNKRQLPFIALSKRAFMFDRLKIDKWMEKREVKTVDDYAK
jgi:excisionase family DNA binding protein